jgi:metabolite-proton symporter
MKETDPAGTRRQLIRAVVASLVGTTIEWYDFFLYGAAAALVFPQLFFPKFDPHTAQILSFGTFTVGFISRPLGGIVFGHLGDRKGRKAALVATLLLMGISTMLVGVLPTYETIGIWGAILLVALRFLQGVGVGGEWGGAVLLALEHGHRGKRGFFASCPQAGVPLGLLLSTGAFALFHQSMAEEAFLSWGWRVPFYLSALLIVIGLGIRLFVAESPLYTRLKEQNLVAQAPVAEAVSNHWREILLAAGCRISENSCFYIFSTYSLTYATTVLEVPSGHMLAAVNLAAVCSAVTIPLFGILSDLWSRKAMYLAGNVLLIAFAVPYYALLETRSFAGIIIGTLLVLPIAHAILYSVQASLIPELFSTRLRFTGASLSYQLAGPFAGGLAPIIATKLVQVFPGRYWPLAGYLIGVAAVSSVCVQLLAETRTKDIAAD